MEDPLAGGGLDPLADRVARPRLSTWMLGRGNRECLLACDDARIAALNADFRGKPTPTNVLSWPAETRRRRRRAPDFPLRARPRCRELGDIAIAYDTCAAEAAAAANPCRIMPRI